MIEKIFTKEWLSEFDNSQTWSERNKFKKESLCSHSYKVVLFTRILLAEMCAHDMRPDYGGKFSFECLEYAIFHDWDEIFTKRDFAHPFKYNKFNGEEVRKIIDEFTKHVVEEELKESKAEEHFADLIKEEDLRVGVKKLVKLADWIAMLHFCYFEIQMGNVGFEKSYDYTLNKFTGDVEVFKKLCEAYSHNPFYVEFKFDVLDKFLKNFKRFK